MNKEQWVKVTLTGEDAGVQIHATRLNIAKAISEIIADVVEHDLLPDTLGIRILTSFKLAAVVSMGAEDAIVDNTQRIEFYEDLISAFKCEIRKINETMKGEN